MEHRRGPASGGELRFGLLAGRAGAERDARYTRYRQRRRPDPEQRLQLAQRTACVVVQWRVLGQLAGVVLRLWKHRKSAAGSDEHSAPHGQWVAEEGQTLSASTGTWTESPTSYAYQWQDCNSSGESCATISGATTSSYTLARSTWATQCAWS